MTSKLLGKTWVRVFGYQTFFSFALLAAAWLTFPYDALRDRVAAELGKRLKVPVEIGKVRFAGVSGLSLHDLTLVMGEAVPVEDAGEAEGEGDASAAPVAAGPARVTLDRVTAKAELIPLIRGSQAFTFDIEAFGGTAEGRYETGKERTALKAHVEKVALARTPLRPVVGVDLDGMLSSVDVDLSSEGRDFSKATGSFAMKGDGLVLNGGEVQHFELPKITLGTLEGKVTIDGGKANVDAFQIAGEDLEAQLEGNVKLAAKLGTSAVTGKLKIKPSDGWWSKNEMLKNMANFALPAGKDGWRTLNLYGQLQKPGFRPQK